MASARRWPFRLFGRRKEPPVLDLAAALREEISTILHPGDETGPRGAWPDEKDGPKPRGADREVTVEERGALADRIVEAIDRGAAESAVTQPEDMEAPPRSPPGPPGGGAGMAPTGAEGAPLYALCLSGGGIRSAAVCLGVVQALARARVLERFHYLSTVSGGGYTGSLIWRLIREVGGVRSAQAALADPDGTPGLNWLLRLRENTSYLAPRLGLASLDVWAAVVLYVRNTLVNWVLFLPGLLGAAALPQVFLLVIERRDLHRWLVLGIAAVGLAVAVGQACRWVPVHRKPPARPSITAGKVIGWITLPLVLLWTFLVTAWFETDDPRAFAAPAVAFVASILAYLVAWLWPDSKFQGRQLFLKNLPGWALATAAGALVLWVGIRLAQHFWAPSIVLVIFGPAWVVASHLVHSSLYATLRIETEVSWQDREWIARLSATEVLAALLWTVLSAICLLLPHYLYGLYGVRGYWTKTIAAVTAALSGPVAAALGGSAKTGFDMAVSETTIKSMLPEIATTAATALFLLVLLTGAASVDWVAGQAWWPDCFAYSYWPDWQVIPQGPCAPGLYRTLLAAIALIGVSWGLGRLININRFSLHELYRNRLVRAFLGAVRPDALRMPDGFTLFAEKDAIPLHCIWPAFPNRGDQTELRLFPVVNTALNLVAGTRTAWTERKAASFTMTPLHCGSAVIAHAGAFVRTPGYGGTPFSWPRHAPRTGLSLGTAMTISGAAVSPNGGYHSSPTTSFIMTMFNARLGAWMPNPRVASTRDMERSRPPNAFRALLAEMFGQTDDSAEAIYLSDGGHFENLGLYEMLRRRCAVIVAVDAGCDPNYQYFDLGGAIRKARIDLNIEVSFPSGGGPVKGEAPTTPSLAATIQYPAVAGQPASTGVLIYVKVYRPDDAPADIIAYAASHDTFPHESTSNQFFTESQFESYRRLGEVLAA